MMSDTSGGRLAGATASAGGASVLRHHHHQGQQVVGSTASSSSVSSNPSSSSAGSVVRAQPATDKHLMEAVAGFISDVQALHNQQSPFHHPNHQEPKPHVTWARFETLDLNDPVLYPECLEVNGNSPSLVLVLGYTQGVQVWLIPGSGEAQEVLSYKHGQIKALKVLRTPINTYGSPDNFAHCRPLAVMVDSSGPGPAFSSATFSSLKTGEIVHNIKFSSEIAEVFSNRRVVVVSFREKLAAFDACNLEARFTVTSCYPSPGVHANPVSLGNRWLAYADQRCVSFQRSQGGKETDGNQSVTAWGINVGSKLAYGVSKIYSNLFNSSSSTSASGVSGGASRLNHPYGSSSLAGVPSSIGSAVGPGVGCSGGLGIGDGVGVGSCASNEPQKGIVTILDVVKVYRPDREEVNLSDKIDGVIAHFVAHTKAIVAMQFDNSGSLLLTCDRMGSHFNLFRIVPHPAGSCYTAVHHIYSLHRGDTPGTVQDIAFSPDARWVAVSTLRGTTHIFPITPYGGPIGVRTHTSARVVNRLSRFHRSAGIDEDNVNTGANHGGGHGGGGHAGSGHVGVGGGGNSGRSSPNPTLGSSPVFSKLAMDPGHFPVIMSHPNPHVPPFPIPTIIQPIEQLRHSYLSTLTSQTLVGAASAVSRKPAKSSLGSGGGSGSGGSSVSSAIQEDVPIRLAATFAPSRARVGSGPQSNFFARQNRRMSDSLFVVANHGVLLEYQLDPLPDSRLEKSNICESSPIELNVMPYGQWVLTSPRDRMELQAPLPHDCPLMASTDQLMARGVFPKKDQFTAAKDDLYHHHHQHYQHHHHHHHRQQQQQQLQHGEEDRWLSQVEIVTHTGPHRRLWMGPQFCFKTVRTVKSADGKSEESVALDLDPSCNHELSARSNPMNMPSIVRHGNVPVFIEAGSAGSVESSLGNICGSREQMYQQDVENELIDAMADTSDNSSLLEGPKSPSTPSAPPLTSTTTNFSFTSASNRKSMMNQIQQPKPTTTGSASRKCQDSVAGAEEEFFCLTPDGARSLSAESAGCGGGGRSRNASSASGSGTVFPVQMGVMHQDTTRIFSLAVETGASPSASSSALICDVVNPDLSSAGRSYAVIPAKDPSAGSKGGQQSSKAVASGNGPEFDVIDLDSPPRSKSHISGSGQGLDLAAKLLLQEALEATEEEDERGETGCVRLKDLKLVHQDDDDQEFSSEFNNVGGCSSGLFGGVGHSRGDGVVNDHLGVVLKTSDNDHGRRQHQSGRGDHDGRLLYDSSDHEGVENSKKVPPQEDDTVSASRNVADTTSEDDQPAVTGSLKKHRRQKRLKGLGRTPADLPFAVGGGGGSCADSEASFSGEDQDRHQVLAPRPYQRGHQPQSLSSTATTPPSSSSSSSTSSSASIPGSTSYAAAASTVLPGSAKIQAMSQQQHEGWSFEVDDLDVNKILAESGGSGCPLEEKTCLDEVFKFDSEMAAAALASDDDAAESAGNMSDCGAAKNGVNGDKEIQSSGDGWNCDPWPLEGPRRRAAAAVSAAKMSASLNSRFDHHEDDDDDDEDLFGGGSNTDGNKACSDGEIFPEFSRQSKGPAGAAGTTTTTTSESSVGNSPNPKKNSKKSKKAKKKRC